MVTQPLPWTGILVQCSRNGTMKDYRIGFKYFYDLRSGFRRKKRAMIFMGSLLWAAPVAGLIVNLLHAICFLTGLNKNPSFVAKSANAHTI